MITIKHLIIFKEVANVNSMSKAAQSLYISQPTISQKIQEIENYYNVKLFQRYSKSLGITEEGKILLYHTTKILNELNELDEIFFHNKENITIKTGITLTVATILAPKLFKKIKEKNPTLNFQVYVDNTSNVENLILENKLDIAIIEGNFKNDNIVYEPLISDELVLICSSTHSLHKEKTITKYMLKNTPFIVREKGSSTRAYLEQHLMLNKIPLHIDWECHSWESVKQAVLYNHGVTIISKKLIEKELDEGLFHILNIDNLKFERMFFLCYHKNKAWNQTLDYFKKTILEFSK